MQLRFDNVLHAFGDFQLAVGEFIMDAGGCVGRGRVKNKTHLFLNLTKVFNWLKIPLVKSSQKGGKYGGERHLRK